MAYLLGSQYCIESLKTDVSDLQTAVTDVCSRTGQFDMFPLEQLPWCKIIFSSWDMVILLFQLALDKWIAMDFAGPVVHPSWKYPDKSASEIDVVELLDIHNFTNDEESNQVAHIILLELVVDR